MVASLGLCSYLFRICTFTRSSQVKDLFDQVKGELPVAVPLPESSGQALVMKGLLRRIERTWDSLQVGLLAGCGWHAPLLAPGPHCLLLACCRLGHHLH